MNTDEIVKNKILEYEIHIDEYRSLVNTEGVWLFLATLGCWGVGQVYIQFYALVITFILFTYRIHSKLNDNRSFSKIEKDIEVIINNHLDVEVKRTYFHSLSEIKKRKHSIIHIVKSSPVFFLSYSFLIVTTGYLVHNMP